MKEFLSIAIPYGLAGMFAGVALMALLHRRGLREAEERGLEKGYHRCVEIASGLVDKAGVDPIVVAGQVRCLACGATFEGASLLLSGMQLLSHMRKNRNMDPRHQAAWTGVQKGLREGKAEDKPCRG